MHAARAAAKQLNRKFSANSGGLARRARIVRRAIPPLILNRFASNGGSGNVRQRAKGSG